MLNNFGGLDVTEERQEPKQILQTDDFKTGSIKIFSRSEFENETIIIQVLDESGQPKATQNIALTCTYPEKDNVIIPYFLRYSGKWTNNNIRTSSDFDRAEPIYNSRYEGDSEGEKIDIVNDEYYLTIGDGERHYILFDKEFSYSNIQKIDIITSGESNYTGHKVKLTPAKINHLGKQTEVLIVDGGEDYIEFDRVYFDHDLKIEVGNNGTAVKDISSYNYMKKEYENENKQWGIDYDSFKTSGNEIYFDYKNININKNISVREEINTNYAYYSYDSDVWGGGTRWMEDKSWVPDKWFWYSVQRKRLMVGHSSHKEEFCIIPFNAELNALDENLFYLDGARIMFDENAYKIVRNRVIKKRGLEYFLDNFVCLNIDRNLDTNVRGEVTNYYDIEPVIYNNYTVPIDSKKAYLKKDNKVLLGRKVPASRTFTMSSSYYPDPYYMPRILTYRGDLYVEIFNMMIGNDNIFTNYDYVFGKGKNDYNGYADNKLTGNWSDKYWIESNIRQKDGKGNYEVRLHNYAVNRIVWDKNNASGKNVDISDFYKLPFFVDNKSCFQTKANNEIDFSDIAGNKKITSKPVPTRNTKVINTGESTGENALYLNNITIVYTRFDNSTKDIKLIIRYEKRASSAQYDGKNEVFDGNTTWSNLVLKGTSTSSSGGEGGMGNNNNTAVLPDRNVYVKR